MAHDGQDLVDAELAKAMRYIFDRDSEPRFNNYRVVEPAQVAAAMGSNDPKIIADEEDWISYIEHEGAKLTAISYRSREDHDRYERLWNQHDKTVESIVAPVLDRVSQPMSKILANYVENIGSDAFMARLLGVTSIFYDTAVSCLIQGLVPFGLEADGHIYLCASIDGVEKWEAGKGRKGDIVN